VDLAGFAGAARGMADRAQAGLAVDVARRGARELLAVMEEVTPVRSGHLRSTETVQSVTGDGAHAVALVGPDAVYDKFRNDGGTITRHGPGSLGTPAVGFFGHSVTQRGSHYMERAEEEARPFVEAMARIVLDEYLKL
jgi:hypothetical protein